MWTKKFSYFLIPVPRTSLILLASCPMRGASRGVTEVGQSESLIGAGYPKPVGCGARGHASQAWTRGALGNRPGPLRGSAFNGWTRQVKGGETCLDGELARACARKHGPRDEEVAATGRSESFRWPLFLGNPGNKLRH